MSVAAKPGAVNGVCPGNQTNLAVIWSQPSRVKGLARLCVTSGSPRPPVGRNQSAHVMVQTKQTHQSGCCPPAANSMRRRASLAMPNEALSKLTRVAVIFNLLRRLGTWSILSTPWSGSRRQSGARFLASRLKLQPALVLIGVS